MKVLYRNTNHIQQMGGPSHEALHALESTPPSPGESGAEALRAATRRHDLAGAEQTFAALTQPGRSTSRTTTFQYVVQDNINVHRVVLAWRSWALLDFTGKEHAHTLLRQSIRFCVDEENNARKNGSDALRALLPKLLERDGLASRAPGDRQPGDDWIERMSQTIYSAKRDQAAEAVAEALRDGVAPEAIGEAMSLAANQLVLHDPGRRKEEGVGKPIGSVHGASVGVHASDAANAWRNIARVSDRRNVIASLIVGAYHTAGQSGGQNPQPYPFAEHREKVVNVEPADLLAEAETAIRAGDQARASPCWCIATASSRPSCPARLRPAAPLRDQRGRRVARREVLPDRHRGVRHHPPGLPLAATGGPGARHGQRIWAAGTGSCRGAAAHRRLSRQGDCGSIDQRARVDSQPGRAGRT